MREPTPCQRRRPLTVAVRYLVASLTILLVVGSAGTALPCLAVYAPDAGGHVIGTTTIGR